MPFTSAERASPPSEDAHGREAVYPASCVERASRYRGFTSSVSFTVKKDLCHMRSQSPFARQTLQPLDDPSARLRVQLLPQVIPRQGQPVQTSGRPHRKEATLVQGAGFWKKQGLDPLKSACASPKKPHNRPEMEGEHDFLTLTSIILFT